jgi:hypothetical protein
MQSETCAWLSPIKKKTTINPDPWQSRCGTRGPSTLLRSSQRPCPRNQNRKTAKHSDDGNGEKTIKDTTAVPTGSVDWW